MNSIAPESASPATATRPRRGARTVIAAVVLGLIAAVVAVPQAASARVLPHRTTSYEHYIQYRVLGLINAQRRAHHLAPVVMDSHLILSSRRHDARMAHVNRLSHKLPREAYFATRITRAGYHWHYAGENIGWNSQMSTTGVLALETAMYNEKAPYDGHRRNILNPHYHNVGVGVYMDHKHHRVWLTTDYGRH